jgi:hypothetical protein
MLCGVFLGCLSRVMHSVQVMAMCGVGMVSRFFLIAACLVLGRFFVMAGSMFMVLRCFFVVL